MNWRSILEQGQSQSTGAVTQRRLLACVCLAQDELAPDFARSSRPGGFPSGRPGKALTRSAAALLIQGARPSRGTQERAQHVLALVSLYCQAQPLVAGQADELQLRREACERAVLVARQSREPAIVAFALERLAWAAHTQRDWPVALDSAREAADLATARMYTLTTTYQGPYGVLLAAGGLATWTDDPAVEAAALASRAWSRLRGSAAAAGDLDMWQEGLERSLPIARSIRQQRPDHLLKALTGLRGNSRRRGDRKGFEIAERMLQEWRLEDQSVEIRLGLLVHHAQDARALGDWERAFKQHRFRLDLMLEGLPGAPSAGSAAPDYYPLVNQLLEQGASSVYNALGNTAYDLAACLWESGRAADDVPALQQALAWVDLAEHTWRTYGHNGLVAARLMRARLQTIGGTSVERAAATDVALDVSVSALNAPLRVNGGVLAASTATPGDPRVAPALDRLVAESSWVVAGRVLAVRALWWRRCALAAPRRERPELWQAAEADALEGLGRLQLGDVVADPAWAAEAWWTAALAADSVANEAGRRLRRERLVAAVECVGQLLVTVSDFGHRNRLTQRFSPLMRDALIVSVDDDDADAVDTVLEVLRRDRVGLLISQLQRDPLVSIRVREVVERLLAAQNASPEGETPSSAVVDEEHAHEAEDRTTRRAAELIAVNRTHARAAADAALGVLGVLADPASIAGTLARDVLLGRSTGTPAALLQLVPTTSSLLSPEATDCTPEQWLVRRLTAVDSFGQLTEHTDRVALPVEVLKAARGEEDPGWAWQYQSESLLPRPLLDALSRVNVGEPPLRLLIVPTGLHLLAFDALALPDRRTRLIDHAAVSLHPSLTVARHLQSMPGTNRTHRQHAIASYDTDRLTHAASELLVLQDVFRGLQQVRTKDELLHTLGQPSLAALLAMALHGTDDPSEGWGQAKQLPDGSVLTAAEGLALTYPPLCVLASCHSTMESRGGIELSGFPLTMFARGADTVIGSLYDIEDESTAQIMCEFWPRLAAGHDPVMALQQARLAWLEAEPARRRSPRRWAGLVAYGGAHC